MPLSVFPKGFFSALVEGRMRLEQWFDLAATLDVDGLELYPTFLARRDSAYVAAVRRRIASLGLEMPMLCHSPDFVRESGRARAAEVDEARRMIDLTAALGGSHCRVLSGQRRPGVGDEGLRWVIDSIAALLPHAQATGVLLTLENHYKDGTWHHPEYAQDRKRFLTILEELPSPWLRVQYDPSNAIVAGIDPYDLLDEVLDRVATVHASDRYLSGGTLEDLRRLDAHPTEGYAPMLKHGVVGEGLNDYDRIFAALASRRFDGWISIEDGEGDTVEAGMENLRRSVAFLREKIARWLDASHRSPRPPVPHA